MSDIQFVYQEHQLAEILDYWAKEFKPKKKGAKIIGHKWWVDTAKGIVVFKLTIEHTSK